MKTLSILFILIFSLSVAGQTKKSKSKPKAKPRTYSRTVASTDSGKYHLGPRGGCYIITSGGKKRYVDRSLCN
jgi:hypothetical protein